MSWGDLIRQRMTKQKLICITSRGTAWFRMLMCKHFQLFWLFVNSMLFALLTLLTTYPTTNLFLSLPISAFTNGFWLYFDGYIKCLDSSSTLSSRLALWFLVTLSIYTSRALNLGKTHLQHAPIVWGHKGCILLALIFIWVDILYISVFALSFSVESGHLSSLASLSILARAQPTFYQTQPSWFQTSVEWPSSDDFTFLLWISPC